MASTVDRASRLSGLERILLIVPLLGGLVFGLAPLLAPTQTATAAGASGHDPYIYRLAGAATFGYGAALAWALLGNSWARMHALMIATFVFNVGLLYACGVEIAGGRATSVVYLVLVASIVIVAITGWLLYTHHGPPPVPDIARWLVWFLAAATLLSVPFAVLPLFFPVQFGQYFGFQATDVFIYRAGGAALLGYAMLGATEVRWRRWAEIRSAAVMVVVFNTLAALVSVAVLTAILPDKGGTLAPIVAVAAGLVAVATFVELLRGGK